MQATALVRAPRDLGEPMLLRASPLLAGKLVGTSDVPHGCIEQYRKVAATLHHAQVDRGIKVLMVSSGIAHEGKTLTASNIALTLSQSYGRRVLMIDADLRRPTLHQVFDLPNMTGLSDGLRADRDRPLPLVRVAKRLAVLTAGRPDPDPMSNLTSPRMRRVVAEAAELFEWVIIDTPPVGLLPDAKLLFDVVHAALLVIHVGKSPFDLIARAIEALGRDRIIGVVLNGMKPGDAPAGTYYGYGYYGYVANGAGQRRA